MTNSNNKKGCSGSIEFWINKEVIANIFSNPKLQKMGSHVTYDIMDGHIIFHTKYEQVQLIKDEMGLPYIDSKNPGRGLRTNSTESFEESTKKEITGAKLSCNRQGIIFNKHKRDFKSMMINNVIKNCLITTSVELIISAAYSHKYKYGQNCRNLS